MDRDIKPWAGQLYISHNSEASCKLLYKKFFRRMDCTIIHGQWKQMLVDQRQQLDSGGLTSVLSSGEISLSVESPKPTLLRSSSHPQSRRSTFIDTRDKSRLIASSRHGIVTPEELEPFQCFVLFYTSSWTIPRSKNRRLTRVFGPSLIPKIEGYIRDEFNGEQVPGTSFIIETGARPCRFVVCTSVAKNLNCLSPDYAYNAFRSALLTIRNYNRHHVDDQITSILCPALESIAPPNPYNLVHQMATAYEYWDWHMYAKGDAVLPFTHEDEENISKQIGMTSPSIVRIAFDLDQYIKAGLLTQRGLVYDSELQIMLDWLNTTVKPSKDKDKKGNTPMKSDLPKHVLAQAVVDVLKRPDNPPFSLTPAQICAGIHGSSLESILQLARENKIKIYEEIKPQELKSGEMIAQGTSGKVSVADWGSMEVAVKVFVELQPVLFIQELTMITLVRHPKLVEAIGGYYDQNTAYIVTELLDMNLLQVLQQKGFQLDFQMKLRIAMDIAEAMEFLHNRKIVHRDLKSVNILLNRYTMVAKVCDFGLSRVIDCTSTMTGNIGTVGWIAPEIFQSKKYTERCDIYSYGIILYELMTQLLPFKDVASFKIPQMVVRGERPIIPPEAMAITPKEFVDLMRQCWHDNPNKRPSFSAILGRLQAMLPVEPVKLIETGSSDEFDELTAASNANDDEDEEDDQEDFSLGNVQAQESAAFDELKPVLQRIKHPLVTDELLLKCIRARHGKAGPAKHLLLRYIEWYQVLNAGKPIKISDVRKTLESKVLYYVEGAHDREGRNVIFWDLSNYDVDMTPEPALMRTFVYCLERATESYFGSNLYPRQDSQSKGIILVANLSNWSMARFSTRIINSFFGTVRKYFPVRVTRILFLNAPGWFFRVLTMYQSFISSTMKLIELVTQQQLLQYVAEDNLVPAANGTFHFDMELWIRTRHAVEGVEYQ